MSGPTSKGREGRGGKGKGRRRKGKGVKGKEPPPLHISGYATGVRIML